MARVKVTLSKGPKGNQGDTGAQGATGPQGPQGEQGEQGVQGPASSPAPAPTVSVGTTTTGAAGSNATVVDGDAGTGLLLNFTVPQGVTGSQGPQGSVGPGVASGGSAGQALVKIDGTDYNTQWADISVDAQYHDRFATDAETFRSGATATVELYYTAKADGDGLAQSASSDTPTAGNTINRKIYYSEAAFADPDTGTWVEFTPRPADDASFATVKAALLEYLKARTGGTVPISLKQTWEETEPSTFLLDQAYGSVAAAAYSTRQLRLAQTDCMTIRRASDSTTTTIGFDASGNINESAITTFCTGTTCTVSSWIDQSGNGNNATQAISWKQPTIYTGGALVKQGGRFTLDFDGSDFLRTSNGVANDEKLTFFGVHKQDRTNGYNVTFCLPANATTHSSPYFRVSQAIDNNPAGDIDYYINGSVKASGFAYPTIQSAFSFNTFAGTSYLSGTQALNTTGALVTYPTSVPLIIGANTGGTEQFNGNFQEFITYSSDKSTDRTAIESNIGDYFTQNTPLLDTYSGAAAAYSLRLLDSTYTGSAIRVRRSSDNTEQDINFNVFSELDTVSLTAFAGTGDAFVKTWYDQSGNSYDATQTTTSNQPKIVSSGAVIVDNGKPAVEFVSQKLNLPLAVGVDFSVSWVWKTYNEANNQIPLNTKVDCYYNPGGPKNYRLYFGAALYQWTANDSPAPILPSNQTAVWMNYSTSKNWYMRTNGLEKSFSPGTSFTPANGEIGSFCNGVIQEMIIYNSNESANRTGIETNLNDFYDIY
jgi:hypothetical protein